MSCKTYKLLLNITYGDEFCRRSSVMMLLYLYSDCLDDIDTDDDYLPALT